MILVDYTRYTPHFARIAKRPVSHRVYSTSNGLKHWRMTHCSTWVCIPPNHHHWSGNQPAIQIHHGHGQPYILRPRNNTKDSGGWWWIHWCSHNWQFQALNQLNQLVKARLWTLTVLKLERRGVNKLTEDAGPCCSKQAYTARMFTYCWLSNMIIRYDIACLSWIWNMYTACTAHICMSHVHWPLIGYLGAYGV